ncbi:Lrp/AsnC family transcriptional regulator [Sciscionella sediminilitoris]|uniref:Lrp/AsnC family transcriptional regulator n=1 Tax=Sciscionella sediminilitoris TaxID=1445613 RepID=UPI0004DF34D0|nr:Lrp/AsnC family transcriptional regulator [Sciscionella sp. SE31]
MQPQLSEDDLALLHALQIAPRAGWAELARVLGSTPATLAARWERLHSTGTAWITVSPRAIGQRVQSAMLEIELEGARKDDAIAALCRDPRAVTIEETASGRDLVVTTFAREQAALAAFVLDDLPRISGVRRVAMHLITAVHREGGDWRLDALDRGQQSALLAAVRAGEPRNHIPEGYLPVIDALARDGRASAAQIARRTGRNPATVRRQVTRLIESDVLGFRCEVAQLRSRWPIVYTWFARVPMSAMERTVRALATLPELRLCLSISGKANLVFAVWARSPGDLMRLEHRMNEKLPWLTLLESVQTLRMPKRMGWLLDGYGRSRGEFVEPAAVHAAVG